MTRDALSGGAAPRRVAVLAYAGMSAFELGIVTEVFGVRWPGTPEYDLIICAEGDGTVDVVGGATLRTPHGLDTLAAADTVVIPSVSDVHADATAEVVTALRQARERGARLVSICTGAFSLASAGVLDGRRATTHWLYSDLLQQRFPHVQVDPNPLYVDDGGVLTSAGSAAGLDLCLHLVRQDHGATAANAMARRLVVAPHREGGQAQYIEAPVRPDPDDDRITASMSWALDHLAEQLTVETLAARAAMSTRTYLRHFTRATGTTPITWLITRRVQASLPLLETSDVPIERIATAVGFESVVTFRHHFTRQMRTPPSAYRRAFRPSRT